MNILIVDDSSTNRKLLRVQLEAEGHAVVEASDGVEALAILDREFVVYDALYGECKRQIATRAETKIFSLFEIASIVR